MVTSLGNLKGHKGVCFIQPDAVRMLARIRGCEIITRFLPIKLTAEMIQILNKIWRYEKSKKRINEQKSERLKSLKIKKNPY